MKSRVVFALLVAFALWPLAQHGLVRRYGANPWKLAGWAMYAAPTSGTSYSIRGERDGRSVELRPEEFPLETRELLHRYQRWRSVFGYVVEPDAVGAAVLEHCDCDAITIRVETSGLDRHTARVHWEARDFSYARRDAATGSER